jgi:hypothetical protein
VLSALLVLDGDKNVRFDVDPVGRRRRFEEDVAAGYLPADLDVDAHWVATSSLIYGYTLFRSRFAEELGIPLDELDDRVVAAMDRLLAGVEPAPDPTSA